MMSMADAAAGVLGGVDVVGWVDGGKAAVVPREVVAEAELRQEDWAAALQVQRVDGSQAISGDQSGLLQDDAQENMAGHPFVLKNVIKELVVIKGFPNVLGHVENCRL